MRTIARIGSIKITWQGVYQRHVASDCFKCRFEIYKEISKFHSKVCCRKPTYFKSEMILPGKIGVQCYEPGLRKS